MRVPIEKNRTAMDLLNKVFKNAYWIAAIYLIAGFILMALGNTSISSPNNIASLTIAPILILLGYSFVIVGIMKKPL